MDVVSLAAEFPNDNPALHRGAIWVCLETTGVATAVEPDPQPWAEPLVAEPVLAAVEMVESPAPRSVSIAEIVAPPEHVAEPEIATESEEPVVPVARISGVVARMERFEIEDDEDVEAEAAILVEELPPLDESVCVEGAVAPAVADAAAVAAAAEVAVETVVDTGVETVVETVEERVVESARPGLAATYPPPSDDPFTILLCTLSDLAVAEGSPNIASVLPGLLLEGCLDHALPEDAAAALADADVVRGTSVTRAFVAQTRAWRAILDGSSDDFDACGNAMLDEWAADLLARLLGAPAKATALRRELRSRGVAAFGLIAA